MTNAVMALKAGVTTMRDCGGRLKPDMSGRDKLASGCGAAPRVLLTGAPITIRGGHLYWCMRVLIS